MRIIENENNKDVMRKIIVLILILFLLVCQNSEAGLFAFHPQNNLDNADYLMRIDRPLAADKLINDVINFCKKKNDETCLATAYFYYGKLLMGRQGETDKWYKISSYVDRGITTDNVNQKSMEYFEKALALAKKHELNDIISAIYIKIGILKFTDFKDRASACGSFDQSLHYNLIFQKNNPDQKVILTKGFNSFEEYILEGKKEMGCPK